MKTKHLILILSIFFLGTTAQAQFLKKLKKTAERSVERTILNKTDREVSKSTDKTIDGVIKGNGEKKEKSKKETETRTTPQSMNLFGGGLEDLPDVYTFQYEIDMQITSNKDQNTLKYYVEPNASYFGNAMPEAQQNTVIVYDFENEAMVTFMENEGRKIAMKMNIPFDETVQEMIEKGQSGEENKVEDISYTPIAGKTILGYNCKGYLVNHEDGTSKIYITNEAPVSFIGMFASMEKMQKSKKMSNIPFDKNSMMMEMEYTSNKRKKDNVHMICTSIKEKSFKIRKADYGNM